MADSEPDGTEVLGFLNRFHGHIGPYVVLGYRAGCIAVRLLGDDPFCKRAVTMTGRQPPVSCFTDGVQAGSSCTLGKGNISVREGGMARVVFEAKDGPLSVDVTVSESARRRIEEVSGWEEGDRLGRQMMRDAEEELFIVETNGQPE